MITYNQNIQLNKYGFLRFYNECNNVRDKNFKFLIRFSVNISFHWQTILLQCCFSFLGNREKMARKFKKIFEKLDIPTRVER